MACALLASSGCMVVPYPRDWAGEAATGDGCGHFAGVYDNVGSTVEASSPMLPIGEAGPPGHLLRVLLGRTDFAVTRIGLAVDETGRLAVRAIRIDGSAEPAEIAPGFTCEGGRFRRGEGVETAAGGLVGIVGSSRSVLSKARDGALIVESVIWGAGVAMVMPVAVVGRDWARFPAWAAAPAAPRAMPGPDPYAWPLNEGRLPPLLLRATELAYSRPFRETVAAIVDKVDCAKALGAGVVDGLAPVRATLEAVPAARIVEDALRRALAGQTVTVERVAAAPREADRARAVQALGQRTQAHQVVVADIRVRFGQVTQARCVIRLVAAAEVRVQPLGQPESTAPLFDVWAEAEAVPVETWAARPDEATAALTRLLEQVGADLARHVVERSSAGGRVEGPAPGTTPR